MRNMYSAFVICIFETVTLAISCHARDQETPEPLAIPTSFYALQIDVARAITNEDAELLKLRLRQLDSWIESHPDDSITGLANGESICERLQDRAGCVERLVKLCQLRLTVRSKVELRQKFVREAFRRLDQLNSKDWTVEVVDLVIKTPGPYGDGTLLYLLREAWNASEDYPTRRALVSRISEQVRPALTDSSLDGSFRDYLRNEFRELEWLTIQTHHFACELEPLWKAIKSYLEDHGAEDPHAIDVITRGLNAICHCRKNGLSFDPSVLPTNEWIGQWRTQFSELPVSAVDRSMSRLSGAWAEWDEQMVNGRYKLGWMAADDLRCDLRLQRRLKLDLEEPAIGDLLKLLNSASEVTLQTADIADESWKGLGPIRRDSATVGSMMEYLMDSPVLKGRWFSEADRIVLHVTLPESSHSNSTGREGNRWRWTIVTINIVVVGVIVAAIFRWKKKEH